ncbi:MULTISPECIES: DMT family transporter [Mesorhizobium]|uniref:DMT family transporter n=1 Tax=Mesorhizobium denitrificans TaxID=2294114 RepID=A0A371XFG2_9HYPH|nr:MULTISPECIES: DMT family transporter [Mesorhizobium]RFC67966.1 DMT family transporter [Mesorhizobium denitrificans]
MPTRFIPPVFVLLWATGFLGARYAMPWSEPFSFLAVRFAFALAIIALLRQWRSSTPISWRQAGQAAITGVLVHGLYLGGVFWAVHRGLPAGISALIAGLQPLVTSVLAGWLLKEKITQRQWLGLATGLIGVVVVLWPKLGVSGAGINAATLTASAIAVLAISAGTVWQKKFGTRADPLANTAWQYVGAAGVMALDSALFETRHFVFNGELVFALVWLTFVLSIGAIFLLMRMIREGEMARVSSLFYLVPAVTAIIAWILFDETLTLVQIVGMAIATLGVALATARKRA